MNRLPSMNGHSDPCGLERKQLIKEFRERSLKKAQLWRWVLIGLGLIAIGFSLYFLL